MLVLFRNILTGEPQAIGRTFIHPHTLKRMRRATLGPSGGAAVMLDAFEDVLTGLHIGSGVETVMTGRQRFDYRPAWALGSDVEVTKFPVLSGVEAITLLRENDDNGSSQKACQTCALRWSAAGREVFFDTPAPQFIDLNDAVRGKAKTS